MTRISTSQLSRNILYQIEQSRSDVEKYSQEVSSGIKVTNPGDSDVSGTIAQLRSTLEKNESYQRRIDFLENQFLVQDSVLQQTNDLLIRAKEIATQGANESNNADNRAALSEEVFQIRDQLVQVANTTYQGSYIYSGIVDNVPPYSAATYSSGSTPASLERYVYLSNSGHDITRTVNISESLTIQANTPGEDVFDGALQSLERLGRALAGYRTDPDAVSSGVPTPTAPDGTGSAYDLTQAAERTEQTNDILNAIDLIDIAREQDVIQEQVDLAGRLKRLESTKTVLGLTKDTTQQVLSDLQDADIVDSASNLSLAQTALEAAYSVTARVLNLSIMSYL